MTVYSNLRPVALFLDMVVAFVVILLSIVGFVGHFTTRYHCNLGIFRFYRSIRNDLCRVSQVKEAGKFNRGVTGTYRHGRYAGQATHLSAYAFDDQSRGGFTYSMGPGKFVKGNTVLRDGIGRIFLDVFGTLTGHFQGFNDFTRTYTCSTFSVASGCGYDGKGAATTFCSFDGTIGGGSIFLWIKFLFFGS